MHSGEKEEIVDYSEHWAVRYTKRFIPVHNQLSGHDFFVKAPDTTGKLIWEGHGRCSCACLWWKCPT